MENAASDAHPGTAMKRLEQEPVIRLAEAIDGGDAVDWQKESSEQPALRQTLESLRVVESILQGYRSLARTLPGGGGASVPRRSAPRGATSSDAPRTDRKSTRLNSSHSLTSRMPSSA